MRVVADLERLDVPSREPRLLGDGVHGTVHLPRLASAAVRADAVLRAGEALRLDAGLLPDGRPLRFEVRARPDDVPAGGG